MHTLDTYARALAAATPRRPRTASGHTPLLAGLVLIACALLPLGLMLEVYRLTA